MPCASFMLAAVLPLAAQAAGPSKIVYLMMENRAFDHMLGFLPGVNGWKGNETMPLNPLDPSSPRYPITNTSAYIDPDPAHEVKDTTVQLFGTWENYTEPAPMDGFVANALSHMNNDPSQAVQVIHAFAPSDVPIISTLAQEFAIVDGYHSSVPGPTYINRLYAISATSQGWGRNDLNQTIKGWPQRSVFKALTDAGVDWRIYAEEASTAFLMQDCRSLTALSKMKFLNDFFEDVANSKLAPFSFIDPAYFTVPGVVNASDQHPSHDVLDGERLLKRVYEGLRASPEWENTALVIVYDEHGGFADHVPPPFEGVPNPDGLPCSDCGMDFSFNRLGVRVPFIVVSPWVKKGTIISSAPDKWKPQPTSQLEHSSLPATLKHVFNITGPGPDGFLTKRDAWAAPFHWVWTESGVTSPRTDCPMTLPSVPIASPHFLTAEGQKKFDGTAPLTALQREWLHMMHGVLLDGQVAPADVDAMIEAQGLTTEAEAGLWLRRMMEEKTASTRRQ